MRTPVIAEYMECLSKYRLYSPESPEYTIAYVDTVEEIPADLILIKTASRKKRAATTPR